MNSQETETEVSEFGRMHLKVGFEAAVIIFQDKIPETARSVFNLLQWVVVWKNVLPEAEIKKIAWKKISEIEAPFAEWKKVLKESGLMQDLRELAIERVVMLANTPEEINEVAEYVHFDETKKKKLLDKLPTMKASFETWERVWKDAHLVEIKRFAFDRMKQVDVSFTKWQVINRDAPLYGDYKRESLDKMAEKAETFCQWNIVLDKTSAYSDFDLERRVLGEATKLAKRCIELITLYRHPRLDSKLKEEIADRITQAEGDFEEWVNLNQSVMQKDKLKAVSFAKMKKTAINAYHWDVVFHRATSEDDKKEAILKMIGLASDVNWAKHAYAHASSVSLGKQAINKMKEISNKLAGTE